MIEQWKELKETITELRDNDGTGTQQEVCKFLINLMDVLEKQMQEPKTGYWRHYEGVLICSECGAEFYDDIMEYCGDDVPKFCLDCGCHMVESEDKK